MAIISAFQARAKVFALKADDPGSNEEQRVSLRKTLFFWMSRPVHVLK